MAYGYNPSYNPSVNYFGNPYTPMMNQAGQMQPQQPMQMGQNPQQMTDQQPGTLFARYVASREEAVAAMVVSDGRPNLFVDEAHSMIYVKAVAPNGVGQFRDFAYIKPVQQPAEPQQGQRWAPMEAVEQLRAELQQLKEMYSGRGES